MSSAASERSRAGRDGGRAAYLVTTRSSRIVEIDGASAQLLGRSVDALMQKPLAALVEMDERLGFRSRLALLPDAECVADWRFRITAPDGRAITVVAKVEAKGDSSGGEGHLRWTLVRAPDDAVALAADPAAELSETDGRAIRAELKQLAHEMNQPLAAILTFVRGSELRLRQRKLTDADLEAVLEAIADEAMRASAILRAANQRWEES